MHIGSISRPRRIVAAALGALALVTGSLFAATVGVGSAAAATNGPCDTYAGAGTSCVAAYSSTRALSSSYNGPLYQVQRASDGATTNVGLLAAGGYANAAAQDSFCSGTTCTIPKIYDQTSNHNDLTVAGAGDAGPANHAADAGALPVTVAGHKAYGVFMPQQVAYRISSTVAEGHGARRQPGVDVRGRQRHEREPRLLLRLRQRRDPVEGHRQGAHGRPQPVDAQRHGQRRYAVRGCRQTWRTASTRARPRSTPRTPATRRSS